MPPLPHGPEFSRVGGPSATWAVHQAETIVDFARRSRIVTWLLGGLNFQIRAGIASHFRWLRRMGWQSA